MENVEKKENRMEAPQHYEAPAMETVEVEVEKGFADSQPPPIGSPNPGW